MPEPQRVLVTGAAGFLGWHVASAWLRRGCEVAGTSRDGEGLPPGVVGHRLALDDGGAAGAALVLDLAPSAVIHLAARSRPDLCARDPSGAERVNAEATGALARAAAEVGAAFAYTSSDLVFDGRDPPYEEDAAPSPLGPYGFSKAAGERAVLGVDPAFLVARVSLLYGQAGGRSGSFSGEIVRRLRAGQPVDLFSDQVRSPIEVEDAAELLADLLTAGAAGLVNLAGPEWISRLDHGLALARAFDLDPALCRSIRTRDLPGLEPRPADVSLKVDRLVGLVGRAPLDVEAGCQKFAARFRRSASSDRA